MLVIKDNSDNRLPLLYFGKVRKLTNCEIIYANNINSGKKLMKPKNLLPIKYVLASSLMVLTSCSHITPTQTVDKLPNPIENTWWESGQAALSKRLAMQPNNKKAKNVIVFIGDGMGISTITAARIFDGQSRGQAGEENILSFETFPYTALVKTYNTNQQVPDSAGTASAIHSGIKTRAGVLGINEQARRANCEEALINKVPIIGEIAEAKGMATGIVTTARVTHATPASIYAHTPERNWERDNETPPEALEAGCHDIATQLVEFDAGDGIDIVLGGGLRNFLPKDLGGERTETNLVQQWQNQGGQFIASEAELKALDTDSDKPVMGLFSSSHMSYIADRKADSIEPSLTDMTEVAIKKLANSDKGYYLMVEGGRIDHAHHAGIAGKALLETQEFANAIAKAISMVDLSETLILVTADHSHVFTIAGYPTRGNPILDLVRGNDASGEPTNEPTLALDDQPYTTLGYINGAGAIQGQRNAPETGLHAHQQAAIPTGYHSATKGAKGSETHAGEDVALFAIGAKSHLVGGVMEQHVIFHMIRHALGWDSHN